MKRLTKEYTINHDKLNIKLGTTNREDPQVFYILINGWIKPIDEIDYENTISNIISKFKILVMEFLKSNLLSNKYIFNFDINYDSMKPFCNNYFSLEIILKQKNIKSIKELKEALLNNILILMNNFCSLFINNNIILAKNKNYG